MSITFENYLYEMAKPLDQHINMTYYHGSPLTDSQISDILKNGFDFKHTELKYENHPKMTSKPVQNHIYLTTSRAYALTYACKGFYSDNGTDWKFKYNEKNFAPNSKAVVFEISGSKLTDIYPDEDEIGYTLYEILKKEKLGMFEQQILDVAKTVLNQKQLEDVLDNKHPDVLIKVGKKIMYKLPDELKYYIISQNKNISNKGKIIPDKAFVLDFEDFNKVKTISDFYKLAEVRK